MMSLDKAFWIGTPLQGNSGHAPPSPLLRRRFYLKDKPAKASLAMTALGLYEPWLNGGRVGDLELQPGWTNYRKRLYAQRYDITDMLRAGENVLGVFLGDGWYCGRVAWNDRGMAYGKKPALLGLVEIGDDDDAETVAMTDGDWRWHRGPMLSSDLINGEHYDAGRLPTDWCEPGAEDGPDWQPVLIEKPSCQPKLIEPSPAPPIRVTQELRPVADPVKYDDLCGRFRFVFDFGQNFTGKVRLKLTGPAGVTLTMQYAEVLTPDGKNLDRSNLRTATAIDSYTLRGDSAGETWEPKFTFHGFRYVQIDYQQAWAGKNLVPTMSEFTADTLTGLAVHTDMRRIGSFETGHNLLNRLQENIVWGQRSNFVDLPTDCPQRDERLGWTGDAQVFAPTASFNYQSTGIFDKWLYDLQDAQREGGEIPRTAPNILGGNDASAGWSDAVVVVPWVTYRASGDRSILERHYDMMKRWADFQVLTSEDGMRCHDEKLSYRGYGDWLALDGKTDNPFDNATPRELVGTAYHAYSQKLFARMASILGKDADAAEALAAAERAVAAFKHAFIEDGRVKIDSQTAHLMSLAFDLLPESLRPGVFDDLLGQLDKWDGHLATGFLGTPLWCDVLTRFGRIDRAYDLLLMESFPSWLYPVTLGATTIWERWNSWHPQKGFVEVSMNSLNHYAYGAVGDWMYRHVAGIDLNLAEDSGPSLTLQPNPERRLGHCTASLDSAAGLIRTAWHIEGQRVAYRFEVPAGLPTTLQLPGEPSKPLQAGGHEFETPHADH